MQLLMHSFHIPRSPVRKVAAVYSKHPHPPHCNVVSNSYRLYHVTHYRNDAADY